MYIKTNHYENYLNYKTQYNWRTKIHDEYKSQQFKPMIYRKIRKKKWKGLRNYILDGAAC